MMNMHYCKNMCMKKMQGMADIQQNASTEGAWGRERWASGGRGQVDLLGICVSKFKVVCKLTVLCPLPNC